MSENWKLNKWMEDMTPRRAIQNFFDHATPIDSPVSEELLQGPSNAPEATPLGSQSSQAGAALKRKILSQAGEETPEVNLPGKVIQQESELFGENDSLLGVSELPSHLDSPSIILPSRPQAAKKQRVSMTSTFSQVIQSQKSQGKEVNPSESNDDSSLPLTLESPNVLTVQRPEKKKRVSVSVFSKTLEKKKLKEKSLEKISNLVSDSSMEGSSNIPSNLDSPTPTERPGPKSSKKRESSVGVQTDFLNKTSSSQPISKEHLSPINSSFPHTLESPKNVAKDFIALKKNKRVSTTAFSQILERVEEKSHRILDVNTSSHFNQDGLELPTESTSPSPIIENFKSTSQRSIQNQASIRVRTEDQPGTQVINETISNQVTNLPSPTTPSPNEEIDQYLSLSDSDDNMRGNISEEIIEFTARELQEPFVPDKKNETVSGKGSPTEKILISPATITENPTDLAVHIGAERTGNGVDSERKFKRTYATEVDNSTNPHILDIVDGLEDIDTPDEFAPIASSTQLIKRKPPLTADQTVSEDLLLENKPTVSLKPLSLSVSRSNEPEKNGNMSESDIPSKLNTPEEIKRDRPRPGPASSKKRVSMTEFMAALNQKNVVPPRLETPPRVVPPVTFPPVLEAQPLINLPQTSDVPPRRLSTASSSSSATVPRLDSDESNSSISEEVKEVGSSSIRKDDTPPIPNITYQTLINSEVRSRKSLKFDSSVSSRSTTLMEENSALVVPQPTSSKVETVEETPSSENVEDIHIPETETARRESADVRESNRASEKLEKTGLSPLNRYPALKNSTVVAGGAAFFDASPLSMSPIVPSDKESLPSIPTTPTTPVQPKKKTLHSIGHSPMYISVMQKAYQESRLSKKKQTATTPAIERTLAGSKITEMSARKSNSKGLLKTSKASESFSIKEANPSNSLKDRLTAISALQEAFESSDGEDDEPAESIPVKPINIQVALQNRQSIPDRSKAFEPIEKRLKQDVAFQAKVKSQRAQLEAAKAARDLAIANVRATKRKRATTVSSKKVVENVANPSVNTGNLRFFSKYKVEKKAANEVHELVSEWLDFHLDQLEVFCQEEGRGLDTWEDCFKMLRRQNIARKVVDYTGIVHELLLHDEAEGLLPSEFPPGHYESKREAKRQKQ